MVKMGGERMDAWMFRNFTSKEDFMGGWGVEKKRKKKQISEHEIVKEEFFF